MNAPAIILCTLILCGTAILVVALLRGWISTSKVRSSIGAWIAAVSGLIAWLGTVPPEVQEGWLRTLVDMVPVEHRAQVALWGKLISFAASVYMVHQASHSGPQTPPQNPPTQ